MMFLLLLYINELKAVWQAFAFADASNSQLLAL